VGCVSDDVSIVLVLGESTVRQNIRLLLLYKTRSPRAVTLSWHLGDVREGIVLGNFWGVNVC